MISAIFGSSGHAKEVNAFLRNDKSNPVCTDYFISSDNIGYLENIFVLSESDFLEKLKDSNLSQIDCYIGIGNGDIRNKIVKKFSSYHEIKFPNFISADAIVLSDSVLFGTGNIGFASAMFTVNIIIGNHNHFNLNVSISHDCKIGNYNTFSPGVNVAGNVSIGDKNFFGIGCSIIDNITINNNVVVGAGALVVNDLLNPGTYIGIPAKQIK